LDGKQNCWDYKRIYTTINVSIVIIIVVVED